MSSRLVTTPWFTKNLAGGCIGRARPPGHVGTGWTRSMVTRHAGSGGAVSGAASRAESRRDRGPNRVPNRAAYDRAVLLAIDVGNSNVTIGSFRNGSLTAVRRAATPASATADELEVLLEELLRLDDTAFADIAGIACASVV